MISVVIPTRNRSANILPMLELLHQQVCSVPYEVLVVDNASDDDTAVVLARCRELFGITVLSASPPNRGLARNRGVAAARGQLIVFIDDDVFVADGFLEAHWKAHQSQNACVVTGPIMMITTPNERPKPRWVHWSRAFFCTCNVSVGREAFLGVGGFDEGFTGYGWEDTEIGVRLRTQGLHHVFAWDAGVYHLKPPGWESGEAAAERMWQKGCMARRFVQLHPTWRVRLATGAHPLHAVRAATVAASWTMPLARCVERTSWMPGWVRAAARAHVLDGHYRAGLTGGPRP